MINLREKASSVRRDRIAAATATGVSDAPHANNDHGTSAGVPAPAAPPPVSAAPASSTEGKGAANKFRRYTIMLDEDVGRRLRLLAVERGVKLHALTSEIVTAYLSKQES